MDGLRTKDAALGGPQSRRKPKTLTSKLDLPRNHPILSELEKQLGILSDSSVHFTPEYFGSQHWIHSESRIELRYFTSDQRTIERDLITLTGIHASILRIFDECLTGSFFSNQDWQKMWQQLETQGNRWPNLLSRMTDQRSCKTILCGKVPVVAIFAGFIA